MLIDIDPQQTDKLSLRYVLAPGPTPASTAYASLLPSSSSVCGRLGEGEECKAEDRREGEREVCPEGLLVAKEIGRRVVGAGGAALIIDYGDDTVTGHTLRVSARSVRSQVPQ